MSKAKVVTLDVREDLRRGREPFSRIMQAVGALAPDQDFVLLAPFEPSPLYAVLAQHGFSHSAKSLASGDWEVRFSHAPQVPPPAAATPAPSRRRPEPDAGAAVVEVDARGLEPPQPLVKILEALTALPSGARLRAHTDRRPMHLYAKAEERGFIAQSEEQPDGSFITDIRRG